jgi:nucleotide-binding universal stress UspA family protein
MIKDIIVNLTPDLPNDPAARYAISMAETFDAHIGGVVFAYDPPWPPSVLEGAAIDVFRTAKENLRVKARATLTHFEETVKRSQVQSDSHFVELSSAGSTQAFASMARAYDISVLRQPDPDRDDEAQDMIEAALFGSGRPALVVPYIQREGFSVDRVICCWDGSRAAARAINDSLPLLHKAKSVKVLTIVTGKFDDNDVTGADIAAHLARHKLRVDLDRVPAPDIDVPSAILSYAADANATLLVMGGFGHSRLRDFVLGGATRGLLGSMTVPTLMSH